MNILIILLVICFGTYVAGEKNVVCYYGSWAAYRNGLGKFEVSNINTDLCTHLVYTFAGIDYNGVVISLDPYLDLPDNWGRDSFRKFNALKNQNPKLKTLLAVGGWNEGSAKYSVMAASTTTRKNFISSALNMIQQYGFDGLDLDWEYPNRRDSVYGRADINNFTLLLKDLKQEFAKYGLLVTALVTSVGSLAALSYDVPGVSQYLDLVSIMAYDMTTGDAPYTGHSAPLHSGDGVYYGDNTVEMSLKYWLSQGCPPEKLILGLPLYGHTFKLKSSNNNSIHAPSQGPGIAGPYTVTSGMIGYNEFCYKLQRENWELRYDSKAKVPYAVQGLNWVSFDNVDSLVAKVEYASTLNIGGAMVWSIETDDFHGICHSEDFPLLRAVNNVLNNLTVDSNMTTSSPSPATDTTVPSTTEATEFACKEAGLAANPKDCASFYICIRDLNGELVPRLQKCPNNLLWDQSSLSCNYAELVDCHIL